MYACGQDVHSVKTMLIMHGLISMSASLQARNHHQALTADNVRSTHAEYEPWLSRQQHRTDPTAYPTTDCNCDTLGHLHAHAKLQAPASLGPPALGEPGALGPQRIATSGATPFPPSPSDLFSEVYVISLASRLDRRQYMCAALQRLGIPALIWPALPSDSTLVQSIRRGLVQERKRQAQRGAQDPAAAAERTIPEDMPTGSLPLPQALATHGALDAGRPAAHHRRHSAANTPWPVHRPPGAGGRAAVPLEPLP